MPTIDPQETDSDGPEDLLRPVGYFLFFLYSVLSIAHYFLLQESYKWLLIAVGAFTALLSGVAARNATLVSPPTRYKLLLILLLMCSVNSLLHLWLSTSPVQTTNIFIALIAAGIVLSDRMHWFIAIVFSWFGWILIVGTLDLALTQHFFFAMAMSTLLSWFAHLMRKKLFEKQLGLETERNHALQREQDSQEKMYIAADSIGGSLLIFDIASDGLHFTYSKVNAAAAEFYSLTTGETEGRNLDNFEGLTAEQTERRSQAITKLKDCISAKSPVFSESEMKLLDGNSRWARHTYTPILDWRGDIRQIMVTCVDITDSHTMFIKLQESNELFEAAFHANSNPCTLVNFDNGKHIDVNIAWENATGWSRKDAIGETADKMNIWSSKATRKKYISALLKDSSLIQYPITLTSKAGGSVDLLVNATILTISGTKWVLSNSIDVTDLISTQKRLENALTHTLSGFVKICASC